MGLVRAGIIIGLASFAVVGCVTKPVWLDVVALNPVARQAWEADEQYGPTFYTKRDELKAVRDSIPRMTSQQQELLAAQLNSLFEHEDNPLLRREAVITGGFLTTPTIVPSLQKAITDSDADVRMAACRAWGRRGGDQAARVLAELIGTDQNVDVRMVAVTELGRFQGPVVNQALAIALDDSDPALQYQAVQALRQRGGVDYGNSIYAWREHLRGNQPPIPEGPSIVERLRSWF